MRDAQIKELISAYIDDELSIDERTLVEGHLADSIEYQQFLDQLRQQRMALRSLPRRKLKDDFHLRVLQAIEQARPAVSMPAERTAKPVRWKTLAGVATAIGTVAALVMLALYLSQPGNAPVGPPHEDLVGPPPLNANEKRPENVLPPEATSVPDVGPDASLSPETIMALREFQELVQLVAVYDITLTPRAQNEKLFESWMEKAGIPINKSIFIDQKLEKEILGARFLGDAKAGPALKGAQPADQIEMLFVRGLNKHIDAVGRQYFEVRAQPNPAVFLKMDLVVAPRELYIFLELNKATGMDVAAMKKQPSALLTPSAFPLQFSQPMHTASVGRRNAAISLVSLRSDSTVERTVREEERPQGDCGEETVLAQAERESGILLAQASPAPAEQFPADQAFAPAPAAGEQPAAQSDPNRLNEPTQAIFIIRRLKAEPKIEAAK